MRSVDVVTLVGFGLSALVGCGGSEAATGDDQDVTEGALSGGPIPESELAEGASLTVVADLLNCRASPGTASAVVTKFKKGDTVVVNPPEDMLTLARTPDGQLWVLVRKQSGASGAPCYVAASTKFVKPAGSGGVTSAITIENWETHPAIAEVDALKLAVDTSPNLDASGGIKRYTSFTVTDDPSEVVSIFYYDAAGKLRFASHSVNDPTEGRFAEQMSYFDAQQRRPRQDLNL